MTSEDQPVRLGYVGAGFLAQSVHLPHFAALPDCHLLALAELRGDLRERVADRFGIPRRYLDHHALLADPELEAVAISGAWAAQGEIARECLAAGKHVFVEKPLAVSVTQAERILEAGRATGARLMVAMMKRYDAGNELAQRIVADWRRTGDAGPITLVWAHNFAGDWVVGLDAPLENSDGLPGVHHTLTTPLAEPRWGWPYKREAEHFVTCLQRGESFRSPGEQALTEARLFEEIFRTWLQR